MSENRRLYFIDERRQRPRFKRNIDISASRVPCRFAFRYHRRHGTEAAVAIIA